MSLQLLEGIGQARQWAVCFVDLHLIGTGRHVSNGRGSTNEALSPTRSKPAFRIKTNVSIAVPKSRFFVDNS
jgi:hypothetical protein